MIRFFRAVLAALAETTSTATPDPVITLHWSELQAIITAAQAEVAAAPALAKVRAQTAPPQVPPQK